MSMTAVVNYAPEPKSVELREIERPTIGEEDVLLRVGAVSVCGSDLHQWTGDHAWPVNYPVVLGHEFGGTIAAVGSRVKDFREGDRVVSETVLGNSHGTQLGALVDTRWTCGFSTGNDGGLGNVDADDAHGVR